MPHRIRDRDPARATPAGPAVQNRLPLPPNAPPNAPPVPIKRRVRGGGGLRCSMRPSCWPAPEEEDEEEEEEEEEEADEEEEEEEEEDDDEYDDDEEENCTPWCFINTLRPNPLVSAF